MDSHRSGRARQLLLVGDEDVDLLARRVETVALATTFTVRVDAAATSLAGRAPIAPYEFGFTTPTPRLLEARWYRKTGRFDGVAVIGLLFNQPMRAADIVAHARVMLTPHAWNAPAISPEGRERLQQTEPAGLERFDEKVAAVTRVAASSDPVTIRAAESWDTQQFAASPERIVVETIAAPPTDGWLTVALDDRLQGAQGRASR